MAHALSFARMNSDTVRKGTPWTCMTVAASRWRGPASPAGRISICGGQYVGGRKQGGRTSMAGITRRYETCSLCGVR